MEANQRVFLQILKSQLAGKPFFPETEIPAEQWAHILKLAQIHQLLPMVVDACYHLPGLAGSELLTAARANARQQVFLQARKTGDFLALYRKLRREGARALVVKGIICRNLYAQPDFRPSSDEDVLIPPEQFDLCHRVLLDYGMETSEQPEHFDRCYEIPYGKKGSPLYLELHKSLFPADSDAYSELNDFFVGVHDRAVEENIDGVKILTMAPTDHLFYLICHAFKHFLHGGFGIRQVCDIVLYARRYGGQVDWVRMLENCESIRAEKFAAALFAIGAGSLDLPVELPEIWQMNVDEKPMLEDLLASGIYGDADMERKHSGSITINAVVRQKRGKDTGGGLMKSLFPAASSLEGRYPYLKKHPALLPVAWASRIVRYAAENSGSDSAARSIRLGNERMELMKQYGILDE